VWAHLLALAALCPLGARLTPFGAVGVDRAWTLAQESALPVALLGASVALAFLTRHERFLLRLAPRTRWGSELGVLLLAPATPLVAVGLGALLAAEPATLADAGAWLRGALLLAAHVAALGLFVLVVRAPAGVRVALLWSLAWGLPAILEAGRLASLLDTTPYFRFDASPVFPPVPWLEALTPPALLVASLLAPRPRIPAGAR
jgi:hypothetical protein